jgi:hypothetical protein
MEIIGRFDRHETPDCDCVLQLASADAAASANDLGRQYQAVRFPW